MAAPQPHRPLPIKALNLGGALANRFGVRPSLDPDDLLAAARKQAGLHDFDEDRFVPGSFREGLNRLCYALEHDAELHTLGRIAARSGIITRLVTRLQLIEHRNRHPELNDIEIDRPVFILGLPRTGTTVLFGLVEAANPHLRGPMSWEVNFPLPVPRPGDAPSDPRIAATDKVMDGARMLAPEVDMIHPMGAMLPQECLTLHTPQMVTYEMVVTFHVTSYFEWLQSYGCESAYLMERFFLQHLQSGYPEGQRWLLKSPANLMFLPDLLKVFPDARFVHTHRDPAKVLGSLSSLYATFHGAMSDHMDPRVQGREQLAAWRWGLDQAMAARETIDDSRVIDVQFEDTLNDPVGTVHRIYEHFGVPITEEAERGVQAYLADNSRDKHGTHTYDLEDFGLTEDEVHAEFADYIDRFNISIGT